MAQFWSRNVGRVRTHGEPPIDECCLLTWTVCTSVLSSYSKDCALNVIFGILFWAGGTKKFRLLGSFGMSGRSGMSENDSSWWESSDVARATLTDFERFREPSRGFVVLRLSEVTGAARADDRRLDRRKFSIGRCPFRPICCGFGHFWLRTSQRWNVTNQTFF